MAHLAGAISFFVTISDGSLTGRVSFIHWPTLTGEGAFNHAFEVYGRDVTLND